MAQTIMREPTDSEIAAFERAARSLAKLGKAGFWIYLANDSLHLMVGPSHDDHQVQQQDRVRATVTIPQSGGGDW